MKTSVRNNIIRKLTNTSWGAQSETMRYSGLSLSTAEFAASVWYNSDHGKKVNVSINEATRIITGGLRPTPVDKRYPIAGIAALIKKQVCAEIKK